MTSKFKKRLGRLSGAPGKKVERSTQEAGSDVPLEATKPVSDMKPDTGSRPSFSRVKRKKLTNVSNPFRSNSKSTAPKPAKPLPGIEESIGGYAYRVCRQHVESKHCHGNTSLEGAIELPLDIYSLMLLEYQEDVPPIDRWLFMDTETTGLAGGTGTLPFVIGIAQWDSGRWRTEQFVLEGPGKERGMLKAFHERLNASDVLVTYNGKSYDFPLIRARCVMNRLPEPKVSTHIDLLHIFRRLYGRELDDVRLTTIESERLGFHREDDLPGSEVPEVYFRFLRTGRPERFDGVLKHNHDDLLAMVGMIAHLRTTLSQPEESLSAWAEFSLAKMRVRLNDEGAAVDRLRSVLARGAVGQDNWFESLVMAGALLKRRGAFNEAVRLLEEARSLAGYLNEAALESLAKLYEHQIRDLEKARRCARELVSEFGEASHKRRFERIEEKLERAGT